MNRNTSRILMNLILALMLMAVGKPLDAGAEGAVPVPVAPYDGLRVLPGLGASQFGVPIFRWSGVTGAETYRLEVAQSEDFSDAKAFTTVHTAFAPPDSPAEWPVGNYYWRVRVETPQQGDWSQVFSFTKPDIPLPEPPSPVEGELVLLSPADGEVAAVGTPFSWTPIDPKGKTDIHYTVHVAKFPNDVFGGARETYSTGEFTTLYLPFISTPGVNGYGYWGVRAFWHDAVTGDFHTRDSAVGRFIPVVSAPRPLSPADGEVVTGTPVLRWEAVDGAYAYTINIYKGRDCNGVITEVWSVYGTSYVPRNPLPEEACWKVQTIYYRGGFSDFSAPMNFTYRPERSGGVEPLEVRPWGIIPALTWNHTGAQSYTVQISRDEAFTDLVHQWVMDVDGERVYDWEVQENGYVPRWLLDNGPYYWRVKETGGEWSAPAMFSANFPTPQGLRVEWANGLPLLRWDHVVSQDIGLIFYEVDVRADLDFGKDGDPVGGCITSAPFCLPQHMDHAGTYYFRVKAVYGMWSGWLERVNGRSESEWSEIGSFYYDPALAGLPAPTGLSFSLDYGDEFFWRPVQGAAGYRFESSYDQDFGELIESLDTASIAHIPTQPLYTGERVYWRVAALGVEGKPGPWAASDTANPVPVALPPDKFLYLPQTMR